MIGKLKGKVVNIHQDNLFLDVHDVGYRIHVPLKTLAGTASLGNSLELFIHTYVREDALSLYGFETSEELFLFEKLLSISGIGARSALSIISAGSVEDISRAVIDADVDFFESISGIGKKSAQRIIVDLKTSFSDQKEIDLAEKHLPAFRETFQALKQIGFSKDESREALKSVKNAKKLSSEALLKEALKLLGK